MSNLRRHEVELILAVAIISVLSWLAVRSYQLVLVKAEVMSSLGGAFDVAKRESLVYLALHGEFPKDIGQVPSSILSDGYLFNSSEINYETVIDHGAINITFKKMRLAGKTLTMRPVMQDDDPTGAVHWVYSKVTGRSGLNMYGVDRTDVDERCIPAALK